MKLSSTKGLHQESLNLATGTISTLDSLRRPMGSDSSGQVIGVLVRGVSRVAEVYMRISLPSMVRDVSLGLFRPFNS